MKKVIILLAFLACITACTGSGKKPVTVYTASEKKYSFFTASQTEPKFYIDKDEAGTVELPAQQLDTHKKSGSAVQSDTPVEDEAERAFEFYIEQEDAGESSLTDLMITDTDVQYPSKTGNPYIIKGVTYYPMESVEEGYSEVGIASWYGKDFHGNQTAAGEIYNMHAMTAAHKTLPIPTYVRVENLDNGKETVVRINDRGPFSKGRIIDLSYAAAKDVDMIATGTARVKITVLSQDTTNLRTEDVYVDIGTGDFAIQIGAFSVEENALRLAESYQNAMISPAVIRGKTLYRVKLTGYLTMEDAKNALMDLSASYPGAFILAE